jgi:FSR family fosmidomycin resistance protein-like MFS transporter
VQKFRLFLTALCHFCVDSYASLLAPILPLINERMGLSLAYAGLLGTIVSLCNLSQPLMGLWADRMSRRYLVVAGALLTAVFSPLLGVAPNYTVLLVVLALGGFGVAAFHPQSFSLAGDLSGRRRSFGLSLFIFGGTMALGISPLWVPYYTTVFGLERLPWLSLPGILAAILVFRFVPLENPTAQTGGGMNLRETLGPQAIPLLLITLVVIARSAAAMGFGFYLTVLAKERGLTLLQGGGLLAIYNVAGVVGSLGVGYLADRIEPKPMVWGALLLAGPALYYFVGSSGWLSYLLLFIGGGLIMSSNSVLVAVAQELAPENSGLASSLPLGFSWGIASLSLPFIGHLADQIGVAETLKYVSLVAFPAGILAFWLPKRPRHTTATLRV